MAQYILRRLALAVPTVLLVTITVFWLMHLIPGDTVMARLAEIGRVTPESLAAMRHELGLDKGFFAQLGSWLWNLAQGDLGLSMWDRQPVTKRLFAAIPVSMELALLGMALAMVIAIPLGIISAIKQDTWIDYGARFFSILGISIPDFWLGTILILYLSLAFNFLPTLGYVPIWVDPVDNLKQFAIPSAILGFRLSAATARMTRATMLDVLRQDFIRTARSKGLQEKVVLYRHALRNAMIPVVTILGTQLGFLLGGSLILETLFSLPGVGYLTYTSIGYRDYPQLQASVLFLSLILVGMNLVVDLSYSIIDPRIRYK